jgi:hypothetical protein
MRKSAALPLAFLALSALVAAAAGCSGNGGTSATTSATATPEATPSAICTAPAGETVQMVFPIPGASAQANLQGVVFAVAPNPLPTNWYFYVTQTGGTVGYTTYGTAQIGFLATPGPGPSPTTSPATTATASPTPLPTPSAVPLAANPIYEAASIGTFAVSTTFNVFLANSNCTPAQPLASTAAPTGPLYYGSFTTAAVDTPTATPSPTST